MAKSILITGGARSGKSALAERLTLGLGPRPVYLATATAGDGEMTERIEIHRARRGEAWRVREEPRDLARALRETDDAPRLVDCLTLWLANLGEAGIDWRAEVDLLLDTLPDLAQPVVFVTNEVGGGIVPANALARRFRDDAGLLNQRVADAVDEVYLCVAGQPLKVKPHAP